MDSESPILQRNFERDDGPIAVEIFRLWPDPKPEFDSDPNDPPWKCRYKIAYPDGHQANRSATGIDSIQALLLALSSIKNDLKASDSPVSWLEDEKLGLYILDFD